MARTDAELLEHRQKVILRLLKEKRELADLLNVTEVMLKEADEKYAKLKAEYDEVLEAAATLAEKILKEKEARGECVLT